MGNLVMSKIAYGSCVEPEGYELADVSYEDICPACGKPGADYRRWESADGAINQHWEVACSACGHLDGDSFRAGP